MGFLGFADTAPECAGALPNFWQELACPFECDHLCKEECKPPHRNSARCKRCSEECLNTCYFVPCCNRFQRCEKGVVEIRADCYHDWESSRDDSPEKTEWVSTGEFCRQ
ncbi:hypothetical protein [Streptomyces lateritius]|uniref:hypothetical protein n=1 Tax=Streptomyces lateritius TaxID=67313 RepID=UPI0016742980|nr:hypothetical protein [Streptomyces lateritius]GGT72381.1 hypothetical protein GCM10010272_14410 [Streptomyces lateritius]